MLAFGLRVLYAEEVLDGSLLPLLPGVRPAAEPGAGGRPVLPGAGPGNPTLPRLRAAHSPGRAAALLLRGLRPHRAPGTEAGVYAETAGAGEWKIRPPETRLYQGFAGAIWGRGVSFHVLPPFSDDTFHISHFERRLLWTKIKVIQS